MNLNDLDLEGATFQEECNGVRWYCRYQGHNCLHIIVLPDQFFMAPWVNGRYVFNQFAILTGEEKAAFIRHIQA